MLLVPVFVYARTEQGAYLDSQLPVETRLADLLGRMTVEEKVGQLLCPPGWEMWEIDTERTNVEPSQKFRTLISEHNAGMLWATFRADPWTRRTLANGLNPELAAKAANALQRYVIENTRLGIPLFLAEEAPHGHMAIGTTVFPTGIGMAATWNPRLAEEAGAVIGRQIRLQGAHISYGPVLDLSREPRWSRVEETMGEDPLLCGTMGAAIVRGLGGGHLTRPYSTIATLKHFLAYAVPEGGQNGNFSTVGRRELLQCFLPPFRRAIEAGALSVMSGYNSIDGIPCSSSSYLLTDILRDSLDFNGFTVSDLYSIEGLHGTHRTASTISDAAVQALTSGLDVDLGGDAYPRLVAAVNDGRISMEMLDRAVSRVLRLKFEMGLFENPYVVPIDAAQNVGTPSDQDVSYRCALESVTLLKNSGSLLPLDPAKVKVAVVGPNADNVYNMLGDYTAPQPEDAVTTVRDGFEALLGPGRVVYAKGCAIRDTLSADIPAAVRAALGADVVVAVVGGSSARDFRTSYQDTGAALVDASTISDMESGEGYDRATLGLMGRQEELLRALKATGKPLVVVYIEGRPLLKEYASEAADALLTAYYPGQEGGRAVADVICGRYNPAGRLPFTVPGALGQLPIYYNRRAPRLHDYVEQTALPRYAFGYGLSYTTFDYSGLNIEYGSDGIPSAVSCTVTNTGDRDGEEVVQLYLHPVFSPTVQPLMQLAAFNRVSIGAGQSTKVTFSLNPTDFSVIGTDMRPTVVYGDWEIMVGAASSDIRLHDTAHVNVY